MLAEPVFDDVFVERVGGEFRFARELHLLARHEPQQRAALRADGAIAGHGAGDLAFDFDGDLAAMAAAAIFHVRSLTGEKKIGVARELPTAALLAQHGQCMAGAFHCHAPGRRDFDAEPRPHVGVIAGNPDFLDFAAAVDLRHGRAAAAASSPRRTAACRRAADRRRGTPRRRSSARVRSRGRRPWSPTSRWRRASRISCSSAVIAASLTVPCPGFSSICYGG